MTQLIKTSRVIRLFIIAIMIIIGFVAMFIAHISLDSFYRLPLSGPIYFSLRDFIREHHRFPSSEKELLSSGHMKKSQVKEPPIYYFSNAVTHEGGPPFTKVPSGHKFIFEYGFQVSDGYLKNGQLYLKSNNEQIFLVDGPYHFLMNDTYEMVTRLLYEELQKTSALPVIPVILDPNRGQSRWPQN